MDRLTSQLKLQSTILDGLLKVMLRSIGREVQAHSSELYQVLDQSEIEQALADQFGDHYDSLKSAIEICEQDFERLIEKLRSISPKLEDTSNVDFMNAIRAGEMKDLKLVQRVHAACKMKGFEKQLSRIQSSTNTLLQLQLSIDRGKPRMAEEHPSLWAQRLARTFRDIQDSAKKLYKAVSTGWVSDCHQSHEVKLLLEGRMPPRIPVRSQQPDRLVFRVIFATERYWYNSEVLVLAYPPDYDKPREIIKEICGAIQTAYCNRKHLSCALTTDGKMVTRTIATPDLEQLEGATIPTEVTLRALLQTTLSPKTKVLLALNVASSFLQLLQTPWSAPRLCSDTIKFLQSSEQGTDMNQAWVSCSFRPSQTSNDLGEKPMKEALFELGIVLMEIWYEKPYDDEFPSNQSSNSKFGERRQNAISWLCNRPNFPGDGYYKAVHYCISGTAPTGSDGKVLWEDVCKSVIDPIWCISSGS
ncbi:hypothetical protein A1O3_01867 [Capronia epimyces CBS 606.96]|uniref:DUF7580 domain-containing protein n=1 Tax=Capronia epimyces CBS 606.96 TaxID=1182542 RepID=W9Y8E1_9EURO|nr:uncharacterized protein A1O3_01867 [Capronia epimyces CBS 606.96]EXJ88803.1 hypothetical protein A1O3_01867 [Capronia epimyces CBS 606.96]